MLDPKYLKDRTGQLPSYVTLGTLAADEVVTLGRVNAAISTTPSATRTALGLGTAAVANTVDFATSAQGTLAGTALQPGTLPLGTTLNSTEANSLVNFTRVNAAVATNASGLRTTLGLGTAALSASTAFAPAANIAKTALTADVQTSLTKADTALQPGVLPSGTTLSPTEANNLVSTDRVQTAIGADVEGTKTILGVTNSGIGGGVLEKFNNAGFSTIGANVYSVLIRYMYGGLTDAQLDALFIYCANMGATTIRVMYPCFSKTESDIYVHASSNPGTTITDASFKSTFLTMSDKMFERAAATGVKLIPCLFWNWNLAPSLFSETTPAAYASLTTQTTLYMKSFTEWFVKRYKNNSALLAYSFTNEWKWSSTGTVTPTPGQLQAVYTMLHETVRRFDTEHLTMIDLPGPSIEMGPARKFLDTFIAETLQVTKSIDIIGTHVYIDTTDWTGRKAVSGGGAVPSPTNALGYEDASALISELNVAANLAGKVLYIGEFGIATTQELDTLSAKKIKILDDIAQNCAGGMVWDVNYAAGAAGNQATWLIEPGTARGNLWASLILPINNQYKIPRLAVTEPSAFGTARKSVFVPKTFQTYNNTSTGNAKFTLAPDMCRQEVSIMFWIRKNATPTGFSRVARIQDTAGAAGGPGIIVLFDTNGGEVYADFRAASGSSGSTDGILPVAPIGEFNHVAFTHMRVNNSWLLETWYNGFCVESRTTSGTYAPPRVGATVALGGNEIAGNNISVEGFCIAGAVTPKQIRAHLAGTDPTTTAFSTRRDSNYISWGTSVTGVELSYKVEDVFPKEYRRVGSVDKPVSTVRGLYKEGFITEPSSVTIKSGFEGIVKIRAGLYKSGTSTGVISASIAKIGASYQATSLTGSSAIAIPNVEWACSAVITITVSSAYIVTEYTLETSSGITVTLCNDVVNTNYTSAQEISLYASGLSGSSSLKCLSIEVSTEEKKEAAKTQEFWRAVTVNKNFFGINSVDWPTRAPTGGGTGSSAPAFSFGTISTMDCNAVHWRSLHTASNTISWTSLDTFVTQAKAAGATRGIYVLYGTPTFLAQAGQQAQAGVYGGLGEGSHPSTLAQLTYFITQLNSRNSGTYAGFFDTIQVWANIDADATMFSGVASAANYFWGSAQQFADIVTTVKAALTAASSTIEVGTPSINKAELNAGWLASSGLTTGVVAATAIGAICANAYSLMYNKYTTIGRATVQEDRYVGVRALRQLAVSAGLSENLPIHMVSMGLANNNSDGALAEYQALSAANRISYVKRMYVSLLRAGVSSVCPWSYGSVTYYIGSLVADTTGTVAALTQIHNELVGRTIVSGGFYSDGREYLDLSDGTTYIV